MAVRRPTKTEADHLVVQRKITAEKVRWRRDGHQVWRIDFFVVTVDGKPQKLNVRGYVGKSNYSFVLLYNAYALRRFTKHAPHKIGKKIFAEPHKHVWDGETDLREAYVPKDIDPDSDINVQFCAFCSECNIDLRGGYQFAALRMG